MTTGPMESDEQARKLAEAESFIRSGGAPHEHVDALLTFLAEYDRMRAELAQRNDPTDEWAAKDAAECAGWAVLSPATLLDLNEQRKRVATERDAAMSVLRELVERYKSPIWSRDRMPGFQAAWGRAVELVDGHGDAPQQIPLPPEPPTQVDVSDWLVERFGPTRSLTAQFHKLISEVGELSDAMLGRTEGFPPPPEGWDQNFRDEAADVVLVVMALAVTEGFDLQEAIASKWSRRKRGAVPAEGGDNR